MMNMWRWILIALVVCAHLVFDVLVSGRWWYSIWPWYYSDLVHAALYGVCIGQINLLATWAATANAN